MKDRRLRSIIFAGILVSIGIVLTNVLSITYPPNSAVIRFGIGYLPLIIISIMLGPKIGAYSAVAQDVLGYFVYWLIYGYPSGPFFPGFTLNAVVYGVVPGLIYNLKLNKDNIFMIINIVFMVILIGIGIWSLVDIDYIRSIFDAAAERYDDSYSMVFVYGMIVVGILGALSILAFIFFKRKESDEVHRIIFIVILLQIIVSIILTPLWVSYLYKIAILPQEPIRIFKAPAEVFLYSVLLIQLIRILNTYKIKDTV